MVQKQFLGEFEELVLLAILKLGNNAYGLSIAEAIEDASERRVSIGALYTTLARLEAKGFISSRPGESTPERGGRAKKYYEIESDGKNMIRTSTNGRQKLLTGLEDALGIGR